MSEDIHKTVEKQIEWLAVDCSKLKAQKSLEQVFKSMSKYLILSDGDYKKRIQGICQGSIDICRINGFLTPDEANILLKLLEKQI